MKIQSLVKIFRLSKGLLLCGSIRIFTCILIYMIILKDRVCHSYRFCERKWAIIKDFIAYFYQKITLFRELQLGKDFDPSRWEGNESNTLQDDFWFGFGHGPRACPGTRWAYLTMKMIVIEIIKKYEIVQCEKTPKNIKMTLTDLKLTSDKPMIIKFRNR